MATLNFQKILTNLSSSPSVQKLVENFGQLSTEIKKKEAELKILFSKEKKQTVALALKKYKAVVKSLNASERKLEKEVNTAVSKIKKSAALVEQNIVAYRKKASTRALEIEKTIFAAKKAGKTSKKNAVKKVTSKKAVKKAAKKTATKTIKKMATK